MWHTPRFPKIQIWNDFLHKKVVEGLGYVLAVLGLPIYTFVLDPAIHWKPLTEFQVRVRKNGQMFIQDFQSNKLVKVFPDGWSIRKQPLLCSISDQGGINRASLDYLGFKLGAPVLVLFDPFHRCWNWLCLHRIKAPCAVTWATESIGPRHHVKDQRQFIQNLLSLQLAIEL